MPGPGHIDLDDPGDCKAYADLYERTQRRLDEMMRQRNRALLAMAFYKSCALSGEVPSAKAIADIEHDPRDP